MKEKKSRRRGDRDMRPVNSLDGRIPPYNVEAEASVLGSVLLNNGCIEDVDGIIEADSFYVESNRRIYQAMMQLHTEGEPIDHVTLGNCLKKAGDLEKIGGAVALANLTDAVASSANVASYAGIVREAHGIRGVLYAAQELVAAGYSDYGPNDMIEGVEAVVEASAKLTAARMPTPMSELGQGVLDMYQKVASGHRGIPLPWPTIDAMTSGLWLGTVTMFVARPGVGKTFVAIIAARHAWMKG